jgi:hypothetical protein
MNSQWGNEEFATPFSTGQEVLFATVMGIVVAVSFPGGRGPASMIPCVALSIVEG